MNRPANDSSSVRAALTLIALFSASCGGKSSHTATEHAVDRDPEVVPICDDFEACGGPVVGRWHIDTACLPSATVRPLACASDHYRRFEQAGVLELTSAGRWAFENEYHMSYTRELEPECLNGTSCAELQGQVEAAASRFASFAANCFDATAGCRCEISLSGTTESSGSYQALGTELRFVAESGDSGEGGWDYCVRETTLTFRSRDATGGTLTRL